MYYYIVDRNLRSSLSVHMVVHAALMDQEVQEGRSDPEILSDKLILFQVVVLYTNLFLKSKVHPYRPSIHGRLDVQKCQVAPAFLVVLVSLVHHAIQAPQVALGKPSRPMYRAVQEVRVALADKNILHFHFPIESMVLLLVPVSSTD